uniref:Poly(A) specific ribonuclease subunit PAN2 n=1 Tax=Oncorhynchus kisutch TaxID=8019 RepID=A0A8C7FUN3_ONCKI
MMNFDGLDPGMGEYAPALHGSLEPGMEPSMDPRLNPVLLQGVELNPDDFTVAVPESVHMMEGMFSELHSVHAEVGVPVTATHFDLQEELLWMGNHRGHGMSFFGPTMGRYSSFQSMETGVLFLSKSNLKCQTRGGLVMFNYLMEEGADMHSLLMTGNNAMLMGGLQNYVLEFDLNTVQQTQRYCMTPFTVEAPGVAIMRQSNRFLFCGNISGKVSLCDLRTFKLEHEFDAFSGSLSDFDVHGNLLAACGFSSGGMNKLACDRFLMVFDLRMMRTVTPLQVHVDSLFLHFIPTYTSRLAIISQTGQCQFCEPTGLANLADVFHVNTVGQLLMKKKKSDTACHLMEIIKADWEGVFPLGNSSPPAPTVSIQIFLTFFLSRQAPPVDPEILHTMKTVGFIGYAPNPHTRPWNQVPYKIKEVELDFDNYNQGVPESPIGRDEEPHLYMVPMVSPLNTPNFDFKHYNRTLFAGLEPHIPNAYCNCMIQALYFLEPIRCLVQNHLCQKEFSLAYPCQASNFLRAFRTIPEASALGLILADSDEQTGKARLGRLIQSWNRFILTQLHQETQEQQGLQAYRGASSSALGSSGESVIGRQFGCEVENSSLCRCGKETVPTESAEKNQSIQFIYKALLTPADVTKCCTEAQPKTPKIKQCRCRSTVARKNSLERPKPRKKHREEPGYEGWPVLFWLCRVEVITEHGQDVQMFIDDQQGQIIIITMVVEGATGKHLSSKCQLFYLKPYLTNLFLLILRCKGVTHQQWYLFNDFPIEPIDKAEAAQFDVNWKLPAILYYAKRNYHSKYDLRIKNPIEASVLLTEASLARKQRKSHATFIPLIVSEMPQAGDLVGLDAEFVTLNQEEAELRSDGTKSTIKPSQMSMARITCVRGQGPNEGVPLIDDYISTQEQVVDYLTQYSGIKPGDLDAKISSKHLTTLKSTYLKLRFLIDTGVRFVGHGLQKDFRVINLLVLKDQVVDTVYLFRKRMISLRFLAWYFLGKSLYSFTTVRHDSIEDARTALALYRKYLELSCGGAIDEVRKVLKGLYEKGRKLDWKVPDCDTGDGQGSPKSMKLALQ